jgi:hypothetical protein
VPEARVQFEPASYNLPRETPAGPWPGDEVEVGFPSYAKLTARLMCGQVIPYQNRGAHEAQLREEGRLRV